MIFNNSFTKRIGEKIGDFNSGSVYLGRKSYHDIIFKRKTPFFSEDEENRRK
jgi:hypothetical protein